MPKNIKISIPIPCHENWNAMTPVDKGRFCASCQKKVFDFTKSSDREIALILKNIDNACGRFTNHQLNRDLVIPKEKSSLWMAASAAIVSFLTIGLHNSVAQQLKNISTQSTYSKNKKTKKKRPTYISEITVNGRVIDIDSISVPSANVRIMRTNKVVSADSNGNFSINVYKGDTIEVSFTGMLTKNITIKDDKNLIILLDVNPESPFQINQTIYKTTTYATSGVTVVIESKTYTSKRTFFGRIFHSISSLFQ